MTGPGRTVRIGSTDLHFSDMAALEGRIDEEKPTLLAIEQCPLRHHPRDTAAWRKIEHHAAIMRDLLFALEDWVKADEAALDSEIEEARAAIRALGDNLL